MSITRTQNQQKDSSVNTSYDAVESAIDFAKKAGGTWGQLAKQGRIKRWNADFGSPQNGDGNSSPRGIENKPA
jgi:hypothetical protein